MHNKLPEEPEVCNVILQVTVKWKAVSGQMKLWRKKRLCKLCQQFQVFHAYLISSQWIHTRSSRSTETGWAWASNNLAQATCYALCMIIFRFTTKTFQKSLLQSTHKQGNKQTQHDVDLDWTSRWGPASILRSLHLFPTFYLPPFLSAQVHKLALKNALLGCTFIN